MDNDDGKAVNELINSARFRNEVKNDFCDMLAIPAMAPENGGTGELSRTRFLQGLLDDLGFEYVRRIDSKDGRADGGVRPNIVALPKRIRGGNTPVTWLVTHMDTVPVNDSEYRVWKTDPFKPTLRNGAIFARGASDNGQDLIATVFAVAAVKRALPELSLPIGIVLVSDEETGSRHGIIHLIKKGDSLFSRKRRDEVIVPDAGSTKGDLIETAEKGLLWMRVETNGKQAHGSRPDRGLNAQLFASQFQSELHARLSSRFSVKDYFFTSPVSTFEPTVRFQSVKNVNTIPGEDTFFVDCRILPNYRVHEVLHYSQHLAMKFSKRTGARITVLPHHVQETAPKTDPKSRTVVNLKHAVKRVLKVKPYVGGIGGNTCAVFFRQAGFPVAVWGLKQGTAHSPNEFARMADVMNSIRVYSQLYINAAAAEKKQVQPEFCMKIVTTKFGNRAGPNPRTRQF